jgi:heme-degrading monooxygenase HmoA
MAAQKRPKKRPGKKAGKRVQESAPLMMTPTADSRVAKAAAGGGLFARVTSFVLVKGRVNDAIRLYEQSVLPAAQSQKGFRGTLFLVDRASGKTQVITFWESEADAAANEANLYYQEQLAKFLPLYVTPPFREGYELGLEVRPGTS